MVDRDGAAWKFCVFIFRCLDVGGLLSFDCFGYFDFGGLLTSGYPVFSGFQVFRICLIFLIADFLGSLILILVI